MAPTIVSGGLIRSGATAGALTIALPLIETWTVADATGVLNGDYGWVDYIGTHGWDVISQTADLSNAGSIAHGGRLNVPLGVNDYQATATFSTYTPDAVGLLSIGPCVRMQGDTSLTFYAGVIVSQGGSAPAAALFKFVAGVQTQLGASIPVTVTLPTTVTLRAVGSQIRVIVNGTPRITVTDTAIPTGQYVGLQGVASGLNLARVTTLTATSAVGTAILPLELFSLQPLTGVR